MILRFVVLYQINRLTLDATTLKFVDLQYIKSLEDFENYFFAGMTLVYWGRLLKYARVWPRVGLLVKIAGSMLIDVGIFLIMFFVFVAGFSLVFHITMGYANSDFRDWEQSLLSSWRMIWGDWTYSEFQAVRIVGPMFFFLYLLFSGVLMLNLVIALLNKRFSDLQDRAKDEVTADWANLVAIYAIRARKTTRSIKMWCSVNEKKVIELQTMGNEFDDTL